MFNGGVGQLCLMVAGMDNGEAAARQGQQRHLKVLIGRRAMDSGADGGG
jgi:hypothetical protein